MEEFITIANHIESEIVEKKSKFIANIFYVDSVEEANKYISQVKKKYFDAKHNCVAYRIIENTKTLRKESLLNSSKLVNDDKNKKKNSIIEKSSDDGEPSGTAGAPMLNILRKNNLANVLIVVTRYFGGILLGTGGLVRAYSSSLLKAIENSEKVLKCLGIEVEFSLNYSDFENFKYYCKINKINILNVEYGEYIVCRIVIEEEGKQKLIKYFELKNINLRNIKDLSIRYMEKSIEK